jgi:hypothetical protein
MSKKTNRMNFQNVLFTNECRVTPYRRRGWFCKKCPRPHRIRRQQGGGDVTFWPTTVDDEMESE